MEVKMKITLIVSVFLVPFLASGAYPDAPSPGYYVADEEGIIESKYEEYINSLCREVNLVTSVKMTAVAVSTTGGEDINEYAENLSKSWYSEQTARDNGIIIVVAEDDHEVVTIVGKGLQEILPPSKVDRIRRNITIPNFKRHEYGRGVYWTLRTFAREMEDAYDANFETLEDTPDADDYADDYYDDAFEDGCWGCWRAIACLGWLMWWDSIWDDHDHWDHHHHHRHRCW
ncbi:hypothetical protein GF359_01825 [candidate division WOR-3 bacterium]|uniref:TPM domain-containing protein n=1 Tax=candidate division WOR-3 bacterium TaxID=2052148 RepID=A0A9D5K7W8_UNCW3|nr:hypothetical protein [candidate division WOR-3 bacterium]MBD3363932.1 hypothetical protein [candidate division WOR-3 bacterium]